MRYPDNEIFKLWQYRFVYDVYMVTLKPLIARVQKFLAR